MMNFLLIKTCACCFHHEMSLCFSSPSIFATPQLVFDAKHSIPATLVTNNGRKHSFLLMTAEREKLKRERLGAVSDHVIMLKQFVGYEQVAECVEKYEQEVEQGKRFDRFLVAEVVLLSYWLYGTGIGEGFPNVHFHAIAYDDEISPSTLGDLYIIKCKNAPQYSIVWSVVFQLSKYADLTGKELRVTGGNMLLPGEVRRPDTALAPRALPDENPIMPRFLCEVEGAHRNLLEADKWCREYFALIPQLRALLLLQLYPRRQDSSFAALAILYRRETTGVQVEDAISFGTAPLAKSDIVPDEIKGKIRSLPIPVGLLPKGRVKVPCPWQFKDNAVIILKAEDLFYWKTSANVRMLIPTLTLPVDDCHISLWDVLKDVNEYAF